MPTVIKWVSYPFTQKAKFTLHVTKAAKDGAVCIPIGLGCPLITAQLSSRTQRVFVMRNSKTTTNKNTATVSLNTNSRLFDSAAF